MSYPELSRNIAFGAVVEATPGTDPGIDLTGDDAIRLIGNPTAVEEYRAPNLKTDVQYGGLGQLAPADNQGRMLRITGQTVLIGAGAAYAAGVKPEAAPLLLGAGMAETLDTTGGSENVEYSPSDDPASTLTAVLYQSGKLYKVQGAIVDQLSIAVTTGGFPILSFSLIGIAQAPTESSPPVAAYDAVDFPIFGGATGMFTLDATDRVARSFSAALNLATAPRMDANATETLPAPPMKIIRRDPSIESAIEIVDVADYDPYTLRAARTAEAIHAEFGQTQYERLKFDADAGYLTEISDVDENGLRIYNLTWLAARSPGGSEFKLTYD